MQKCVSGSDDEDKEEGEHEAVLNSYSEMLRMAMLLKTVIMVTTAAMPSMLMMVRATTHIITDTLHPRRGGKAGLPVAESSESSAGFG